MIFFSYYRVEISKLYTYQYFMINKHSINKIQFIKKETYSPFQKQFFLNCRSPISYNN